MYMRGKDSRTPNSRQSSRQDDVPSQYGPGRTAPGKRPGSNKRPQGIAERPQGPVQRKATPSASGPASGQTQSGQMQSGQIASGQEARNRDPKVLEAHMQMIFAPHTLAQSPDQGDAPVQRKEGTDAAAEAKEDAGLAEARRALADTVLTAWQAAGALGKLATRTDEAAVAVRGQLQQRCRQENTFWQEYFVRSAQQVIDDHKSGNDQFNYGGAKYFLIHESVDINRYAKVAGDARLTELARDVDFLQSFYLKTDIYGEELPRYHGNIRIMQACAAAGQPVDWWDYYECEHWLEDTVFGKVLNPYLSHPIVGNSNVLGRAKACYNDWQALKLQLEQQSPDNPYDETGRGKVKTELMALNTPDPEYKPVDDKQTRLDWQQAMDRGKKMLEAPKAFPGDIHTSITKLKMLRDHSPYEWDKPEVDALISKLEEKFAATDDPEAVKQLQGSSTEVEFDATQPFGLGALVSVLNTIADESGENGSLSFKISAKATVGSGVLNAYLKGWAELSLSYAVTDTLTCVLGFDVAAALGAGISIAGLVEAGGEAGAGFGMKARFAKPEEAAKWIFAQMQALNTMAKARLFPLLGGAAPAPAATEQANPVVLSEKTGFVKGEVSADIGVAAGNAEVQGQKTWTDYAQGGESIGSGTKTTTSFAVGALARMGIVNLRGGYTYTGDKVEGDVNAANNGEYHNHKVNVGLGLSKSITKNPTRDLPPDTVQNGIVEFFAKLEGRMPGGLPRDALYGAFGSVVKQIYDACEYGKKYGAGVDVNIVFEWHNEKLDSDEQYHMQYFRVSVTPTLSASAGMTTKAGGVEVAVNASKTENVFELIGTDNWHYIYQQYQFRWSEEQWREFVQSNRGRLDELMTNMTNRENPAYSEKFVTMLQGTSGFDNRIQVLEQFFRES